MITKEQSQKWDNLCLKLLGEPRARFLTSLLYSLKLVWADDIPTAGTNGILLKINPKFFYELSKEERLFVILHELWHVAKLHSIRRESRDCRLWNIACDYHINNLLLKENYSSFKITVMKDCYKDEKYNKDVAVVTEVKPNKYGTVFTTLYYLKTGQSETVKTDKYLFSNKPLDRFDTIYITSIVEKNKRRKVDGEWVVLEDKERILEGYRRVIDE